MNNEDLKFLTPNEVNKLAKELENQRRSDNGNGQVDYSLSDAEVSLYKTYKRDVL